MPSQQFFFYLTTLLALRVDVFTARYLLPPLSFQWSAGDIQCLVCLSTGTGVCPVLVFPGDAIDLKTCFPLQLVCIWNEESCTMSEVFVTSVIHTWRKMNLWGQSPYEKLPLKGEATMYKEKWELCNKSQLPLEIMRISDSNTMHNLLRPEWSCLSASQREA